MLERKVAILAGFFIGVIAVIANLAWAVGIQATGPWFPSNVTVPTYAISFATASLLGTILVTMASLHHQRLEDSAEAVKATLARIEWLPSFSSRGRDVPTNLPVKEHEVDELARALARVPVDAGAGSGKTGHDYLADGPEGTSSYADRPDLVTRLRADRDRVLESVPRLWRLVAGPLVTSVLFVALAGAMLPAAERAATDDFRLTATVVLFLAYAVPFLVAWSILAIGLGLQMREGSAEFLGATEG